MNDNENEPHRQAIFRIAQTTIKKNTKIKEIKIVFVTRFYFYIAKFVINITAFKKIIKNKVKLIFLHQHFFIYIY